MPRPTQENCFPTRRPSPSPSPSPRRLLALLIVPRCLSSSFQGFARQLDWDPPSNSGSCSPPPSFSSLCSCSPTTASPLSSSDGIVTSMIPLLLLLLISLPACSMTDAIHVVWSESDPPSDSLKAYLRKMMLLSTATSRKPSFRFELNKEDNLNNRFKPIKEAKNDAIFSIDDDVLVPCTTLNDAFTVWRTAPDTMVGFVPRMHWLDKEKDGVAYYKYGGWWSVWWMGTYSMILSKAAFIHRKYLDMYTYDMPSSIHDYVTRERNCEDIAMSLLVANATGAPPIWVRGKIHEIGSSGISSLKGHNERRNKCLNDFVSLYKTMPLVSTNMKAVDARKEWFW